MTKQKKKKNHLILINVLIMCKKSGQILVNFYGKGQFGDIKIRYLINLFEIYYLGQAEEM